MKSLMSNVPLVEATALLGENLARAYRVDRACLQAVVDRIGPDPLDLGVTAA
jgi:hypothetical protein